MYLSGFSCGVYLFILNLMLLKYCFVTWEKGLPETSYIFCSIYEISVPFNLLPRNRYISLLFEVLHLYLRQYVIQRKVGNSPIPKYLIF